MSLFFASGQPMPGNDVTSWLSFTSYLPAVLQEPETYFTILVCFAVYGLAKSWPITDKKTWIPEAVTMVLGIGVACGLHVGHSYVYGIGVGFICAWAASSFYTMAYLWLTAKIRAIFGISPPVSEPVQPDPQNQPPKKTP